MTKLTIASVQKNVSYLAKQAMLAALHGDKANVEKAWESLYRFSKERVAGIVEEKTYQWQYRNVPGNTYHDWEKILTEIQYYGGMGYQCELMDVHDRVRQPLNALDQQRLKRLLEGLQQVEGIKVKKAKASHVVEVTCKDNVILAIHPSFVFSVTNLRYLYRESQQSLSDLKNISKIIKNKQVSDVLKLVSLAYDLRIKSPVN